MPPRTGSGRKYASGKIAVYHRRNGISRRFWRYASWTRIKNARPVA